MGACRLLLRVMSPHRDAGGEVEEVVALLNLAPNLRNLAVVLVKRTRALRRVEPRWVFDFPPFQPGLGLLHDGLREERRGLTGMSREGKSYKPCLPCSPWTPPSSSWGRCVRTRAPPCRAPAAHCYCKRNKTKQSNARCPVRNEGRTPAFRTMSCVHQGRATGTDTELARELERSALRAQPRDPRSAEARCRRRP